MKKLTILLTALLLTIAIGLGCRQIINESAVNEEEINYREEMRDWVITINNISKEKNNGFLIIPQNCSPLLTDTGYADGELRTEFINSIDALGQEGISFGNDRYNKARDEASRMQITTLLNIGLGSGITVLSVNYCDQTDKVSKSLEYDVQNGYISFIASSFSLTGTATENILNESSADITSIKIARNYLILLNPEEYETKEEYINTLAETNYDILIIDAFFQDDIMLSGQDLDQLKTKQNGGQRIVIAYMSIGEAEDYRYYWKDDYYENPPDWLLGENPKWNGNFLVKYWDEEWQQIMALSDESYLNKIIDAGFDGVYLDIVDGYQTFEDMENK